MKHLEDDQFNFYQMYFQQPGKAEVEFEVDIRIFLAVRNFNCRHFLLPAKLTQSLPCTLMRLQS